MRSHAFFVLLLVVSLFLAGCAPDLGTCDEALARTVVYSADAEGLPAYEGQALLDSSCGNGAFCHSAYATGAARYGAPFGLDFDTAIATDAASTDVLLSGRQQVYADRYRVYREIRDGHMPPGEIGESIVAASRSYANLPAIGSDEGLRRLRNWLACDAPIVQGTPALYVPNTTQMLPGIEQIGDILDPQPLLSCDMGFVACGGACVDLVTDPVNCGACGKTCGTGSSCVGSVCTCSVGLTPCGSDCVDLQSDALHCGACENAACGAGTVCYAGGCLEGACPPGTMDCSSSCVDTMTSAANCGSCGKACPAGTDCALGVCTCSEPTTLCGTACVNLATDPSNCGFCGMPCATGSFCDGGACACSTGRDACPDGCVDLSIDESNCGACDMVCPAGSLCANGTCQSVSFMNDIEPIFEACTLSGCHSGRRPAAGMSLVPGSAYSSLVDAPSTCTGLVRVAPGSVADSYLINKLTGVGMCSGGQMPKVGTSLPAAELDAIRAWITTGALND